MSCEALPKIVAVDFDGTLVDDEYPAVGKPKKAVFKLFKVLQKEGVKIILWTCRNGQQLDDAVQCCIDNGLTPDAVNANIPEVVKAYGGDTRKVFADLYYDDKAVPNIQSPFFWVDKLWLDPFEVCNKASED